jgi:hypothetical protein
LHIDICGFSPCRQRLFIWWKFYWVSRLFELKLSSWGNFEREVSFISVFLIVVLGAGILCHLQKFLQYTKYSILEFIPSIILLYPLSQHSWNNLNRSFIFWALLEHLIHFLFVCVYPGHYFLFYCGEFNVIIEHIFKESYWSIKYITQKGANHKICSSLNDQKWPHR